MNCYLHIYIWLLFWRITWMMFDWKKKRKRKVGIQYHFSRTKNGTLVILTHVTSDVFIGSFRRSIFNRKVSIIQLVWGTLIFLFSELCLIRIKSILFMWGAQFKSLDLSCITNNFFLLDEKVLLIEGEKSLTLSKFT